MLHFFRGLLLTEVSLQPGPQGTWDSKIKHRGPNTSHIDGARRNAQLDRGRVWSGAGGRSKPWGRRHLEPVAAPQATHSPRKPPGCGKGGEEWCKW